MQNPAVTRLPNSGPTSTTSALVAGLQALGVGVGTSATRCGATERVSVAGVLDTPALAAALLGRLRDHAHRRVPVCLAVTDVGDEASGLANWRAFCKLIGEGLDAAALPPLLPGFCIHSHRLPIEDFCAVADDALGQGPRFIFCDSLQMQAHIDRRVEQRTRANWRFLWRHRAGQRPVLPVYGGFVRSACPLLSEQAAGAVLPPLGLQVPGDTAWLPLELSLVGFCDDEGLPDEPALLEALRQAVVLADRLLEEARWPSERQRADAIENRRLAFNITGIGELVLRQRRDPASLACLRELDKLVMRIRNVLDESSNQLARTAGEVPALYRACAQGDWADSAHHASWKTRLDAARRSAAVRHRNLLVMSPYAVLPAIRSGNAAFTDLLPLIRHADAWSFAGGAAFDGWDASQYQGFHRRARAVIQSGRAPSLVAAGV